MRRHTPNNPGPPRPERKKVRNSLRAAVAAAAALAVLASCADADDVTTSSRGEAPAEAVASSTTSTTHEDMREHDAPDAPEAPPRAPETGQRPFLEVEANGDAATETVVSITNQVMAALRNPDVQDRTSFNPYDPDMHHSPVPEEYEGSVWGSLSVSAPPGTAGAPRLNVDVLMQQNGELVPVLPGYVHLYGDDPEGHMASFTNVNAVDPSAPLVWEAGILTDELSGTNTENPALLQEAIAYAQTTADRVLAPA